MVFPNLNRFHVSHLMPLKIFAFSYSCLSPLNVLRRYDQFMDRFQSIRAKLDEGEIGEEDFARLVNEDTQITTFSKQEIKGHLSHLSEQGKVMMSDGIVYMID